jgi:proteic killer suppression protein
MEIHYRDKKLKKLLESSKSISKKYGSDCARKIIQRISELQAAECLEDMPPAARPHPHRGSRKGLFSLDIKQPYRLIIEPAGEYEITDIATITEVTIYEITDPH